MGIIDVLKSLVTYEDDDDIINDYDNVNNQELNNDQFNENGILKYDNYSKEDNYVQPRVLIRSPKLLDEARKCVDYLKNGYIWCFDLSDVPTDEARRILYFSMGAVYALNYHAEGIGNNGANTFIVIPNTVKFTR